MFQMGPSVARALGQNPIDGWPLGAQIADVAGGRGDISNRPVAALGAKASDFETRKLAAILAVDIVGFSRLTGADEDRTLASQPRC